jgi:hypothetical protein
MPSKIISLSQLNSALDCWVGDFTVKALGQRCIELEYYPWETKNFPMFLHAYLNCSKSMLERSIKARYLWSFCPCEFKENYLFLYDLGVNGHLTYDYNPTCRWPNPVKASGLHTQIELLLINQFYGLD